MNDKELDNYMKTVNPNFNSHIEKGTIEMSNEYYNLLEEKMARLINQNQELKKKYENAVSDYETTMFKKEQLNSLVNSCQKEIRQLKKQLENYKKLGFKHLQDKNNNLETQQKEFIKYLETWKENEEYCYLASSPIDRCRKDIYEEILQKYKSIIGDNNGN